MEFFESPAGLDLLHRIQVALQLTITLVGGGGIRQVCTFLELSGLSCHIASSYGGQQQANAQLEELMVEYGRQQRERLRKGMPIRKITVCEDETFHPRTCLVGLEPVSGFILLERYADDRAAATWDSALAEATQNLPVEVIQVASDQAKGIHRHVANLGAQASPDLFHLQRDIVKATGFTLRRAEQQAEAAVATARADWTHARQAAAQYDARARRLGRPSRQWLRRAEAAELRLLSVQADLELARQRREQARQEVRAIGSAYHPYDLDSGQPQAVEHVQARLETCWGRLERIAREAHLPDRCQRLLEKAKGLTQALLLTLQFFFATTRIKIEALNLPPELEGILEQQLIPAIYLDRAADRCGQAAEQRRLRELSQALLRPLHRADSPLAALDPAGRRRLEDVARECADLFQRSSSAVEGRNGQLSLHHHGQHRLTDRRLAAKTVVHNYLIRRSDGTTAAQRFFGKPPDDLFQWVLARAKPPSRPAQKRPRQAKTGYLQDLAA